MTIKRVPLRQWDLSGVTDGQRIGLRSHVELAGESLSFVYRMTNFIHHNPLHELEELPFFEAVRKAAQLFGSREVFPVGDWKDLLERGRLEYIDLESVLLLKNPGLRKKVSLSSGGETRRLVDLVISHFVHEWDPPAPSDPVIMEGRPAFFRLRKDLLPEIRRVHGLRMAGERGGDPEAAYLKRLWEACRQAVRTRLPATSWSDPSVEFVPRPGPSLTLLEWIDGIDGGQWAPRVDHLLIKWLSAFLDEGVSAWNLPHRERGFYRSWRSVCVHDREILYWGLSEAFRDFPSLPENPEDTLIGAINAMEIPRDGLTDYLERHVVALPGWLGYVKWRSGKNDDPWSQAHPVDLVMVLAVRLFLEQAVVDHVCRTKLGIPGTLSAIREWIGKHREEGATRHFLLRHGTPPAWQALLGGFGNRLPPPGDPLWRDLSRLRTEWVDSLRAEGGERSRSGRLFHVAQCLGLSPEEVGALEPESWVLLENHLDSFDRSRRQEVWQQALELHLEKELLLKVKPWRDSGTLLPSLEGVRPTAQVLFCIDVRSERLRRHVESMGGYATYGMAGFFGIPFRFQPFQKTFVQTQAPVLLNPRHRVRELPRAYEIERADRHFLRQQKIRSLIHLFHELKDHIITPYVLVEALGWFYLFPFVGRSFFPSWVRRATDIVREFFLPEIATALTVAKVTEPEALAMIEAEQHARIRKACLDLLGPHTRSLSAETVEELRQRSLEEGRSLERLGARAREELGINLTQEADLLRKLRTLYLVNTRRTRVLLETIMTMGFSTEEQAFYIENSLRMIGLTKNFSRLVLICGHGSESLNNPFESALDCGACGGNRGIPNARVFVEMANSPAVRDLLRKRGIDIPYDSHFLAGEHNTVTDRVVFFDLESVPLTHRRDLKRLWRDLGEAGRLAGAERLRDLPRISGKPEPARTAPLLLQRSCDISEVRPEWGLSGNSWFIVGTRSLANVSFDFAGRAFLHSYDPALDPSGRDLEAILTGPLVVGQWINAEHYFSALDGVRFGGGNKIYHNVTGYFGVMWGNESDLLPGLPHQTIREGDRLFHEPVRLSVLVESSRETLKRIIDNNPVLRRLLKNEWVRLLVADPGERDFFRYDSTGVWRPIDLSPTPNEERTL